MRTPDKPQWRIVLGLALACILLLPMVNVSGIAAQFAGEQIPGPPPEHPMPPDLPMQSNLFDAEQLARRTEVPDALFAHELQNQGFITDDQGKVLAEIVGPVGGKPLPNSVIERFGGETLNTWGRLVSAWIPVRRLTALARALPPGYYLERAKVPHPNQNPIRGEGPSVTNSADYRDQGADCSGLTIAVIDGGWDGLTEAIQNGDAPATFTTDNFTSDPFEDPAAGTHGTAILETVYDHCPGAAYRLYKIGTRTDTGPAITDAINHGISVIVYSLSFFNLGWADDSGDICTAANNAGENGILFFASSGNYGEAHWQGDFADAEGDGWHDFRTGDETIRINMPANSTASFYLSWDTSGGTYNHNFYLYDATITNVLGQGVNGGNNYEEIWYTNHTGAAQTVHLAIWRASGGITEMEVFMHTWAGAITWQQHVVAEGSTTTPSNCTHPNVISVGAVEWGQFGSASGAANIIQPYSSQGPSNSGMTLPDIVAPDDTRTLVYIDPGTNPDGRFPGTSCSAPNAAGAAAAFWSSVPSLSPEAVGYLVFEQAGIYKDWGGGGDDNVYGRGGVWLHTYHDNTVWVDRRYNNLAGLATAPYYYVAHAQNAAVSGGRVAFLGGSYLEPVTLNKNLMYETIGSTAELGAGVPPDGTVDHFQKISDTQGNFAVTLDDEDRFGVSVASIGDLDGDGVSDLAVGAHRDDDGGADRGAVYVLFMNGNGTVDHFRKISDTQGNFTATLDDEDHFGISVAAIGDLDGDGVTDLAVGANSDDDGGTNRGAVYVLFMNTNGTVRAFQKISDTQGNFTATLGSWDTFGVSVAAIGDLDGDGVTDLAVGADYDDDGGTDRGAVYVLFMRTDGTVKGFQKISDAVGNFTATLDDSDTFGREIAAMGDLDGDGVTDLAVGARYDDDGGSNRGAVYVLFMNTNGTVKGFQKISDTAGGFTGSLGNSDRFGISIAGIGDLDGDGVADLAVGADNDDDGGTDRGAVYVLFMRTDGTVKDFQKISDRDGSFTAALDDEDWFGSSIAALGDLDGDGVTDLAVGAQSDDDGGPDRGAVYVLFVR